jgi:hypothetical protein
VQLPNARKDLLPLQTRGAVLAKSTITTERRAPNLLRVRSRERLASALDGAVFPSRLFADLTRQVLFRRTDIGRRILIDVARSLSFDVVPSSPAANWSAREEQNRCSPTSSPNEIALFLPCFCAYLRFQYTTALFESALTKVMIVERACFWKMQISISTGQRFSSTGAQVSRKQFTLSIQRNCRRPDAVARAVG